MRGNSCFPSLKLPSKNIYLYTHIHVCIYVCIYIIYSKFMYIYKIYSKERNPR